MSLPTHFDDEPKELEDNRKKDGPVLFPIQRFLIDLCPTTPIAFSQNKGSALHGGFGAALKSLVCVVKNTPCPQCPLYRICVYPSLFETPIPHDSTRMPKASAIPRPYILEPPIDGKRLYQIAERFQIGLVLMGQAIDNLPYCIATFEKLGQQGIGTGSGRFRVLSVKQSMATDGDEDMLSDQGHKITLKFLTPTRIEVDGKVIQKMEFSVFFKSLLRRFRNLQYFHWKPQVCVGDEALLDLSRHVQVEKEEMEWMGQGRLSHGKWMPQGGLVGEITFRGDMVAFMPFLKLGELVHVGKGVTFGMGRYRVDIIKEDL